MTDLYNNAWIERQKQLWFSVVDDLGPTEPRKPRIDEIQTAVAKHYGVKRFDMLSARRTADVVRPRQIAMYLCKQLTLRSTPDIGRRFGDRDHTTVIHAVKKIELLAAKAHSGVASDLAIIRAELRA
ncbi:MAG TPA: helix-turn-helix domain-containing protein [Verrucomicrobiae bacterium]|nr:helix-turn-helix domain-containing protein [Verrucomicrobiae bacterium]